MNDFSFHISTKLISVSTHFNAVCCGFYFWILILNWNDSNFEINSVDFVMQLISHRWFHSTFSIEIISYTSLTMNTKGIRRNELFIRVSWFEFFSIRCILQPNKKKMGCSGFLNNGLNTHSLLHHWNLRYPKLHFIHSLNSLH
jgi:hypothetical protein